MATSNIINWNYNSTGSTAGNTITLVGETTIQSGTPGNLMYLYLRPCGCTMTTPQEKIQLVCFGCDKNLCSNCAIINKDKSSPGIWCAECNEACKVAPFTRQEMMEKLFKTFFDLDLKQIDRESETQDSGTPEDSDDSTTLLS